jgi:hypothetical protein
MKPRTSSAALLFALLATLVHVPGLAQAPAKLSAEEAHKIGVEGVAYGLPLVIMELTKRVSTNVPRLPAAAGEFSVTMRVYWPKPAMIDGTWAPPPVKRAN